MILLLAVVFTSVLVPALSTSDIPHALARLHEARARIIANRARLRANSARIAHHHRPTASNRSKRQYSPYQVPEQPYPVHHYEEPLLVHICPAEDDHDAVFYPQFEQNYQVPENAYVPQTDVPTIDPRMNLPAVAENTGKLSKFSEQDFSAGHKHEEKPVRVVENPHSSARIKHFSPMLSSSRDKNALNEALEELKEAKLILDEFEEENSRPLPNSKYQGGAHSHSLSQTNPQNLIQLMRQRTSGNQKPLIADSEKSQISRDADAHLHSHGHSRLDIHQHGHNSLLVPHGQVVTPGFHIPQTQVVTPGFHVPQAHVVTPGLNLNINQGHHTGVHSTPTSQGIFSSVNQISPHTPISYSTNLNHQNGLNSNFQQGSGFGLHDNHKTTDHGYGFNQKTPVHHISGGHNQKLGDIRSLENEAKSEEIASSEFDLKEASATLHKEKKMQPVYYPQYPYHPPQYGKTGPYRENEEDNSPEVDSSDISHPREAENGEDRDLQELTSEDITESSDARGANPTHKELKKKPQPQYYQPYPSYDMNYQQYGRNIGSYREADGNGSADVTLGEESGSEDSTAESSDIREANPTHKKKKKKMEPQYYQPYPSYSMNYQPYGKYHGSYREADGHDDGTDIILQEESPEDSTEESSDIREANPTHKKKKKKMEPQYYQPYPSYSMNYQHYGKYHGPYREADGHDDGTDIILQEESPEDSIEESSDIREANPTHKKKKKKMEPQYYQPYPSYGMNYQQYGKYHGAYREADGHDAGTDIILQEESPEDSTEESSDIREANPTHKKKKKKMEPQYYQPYPSYGMNYQHHGKYHGPYREADGHDAGTDIILQEESPEDSTEESSDIREANPTHKKKKKKMEPLYYQPYPSYSMNNQQYGKYHGPYREADGTDITLQQKSGSEDISDESSAIRESNSRPNYYGLNIEPHRDVDEIDMESRKADDAIIEPTISSPFLFDFPARRLSNHYKRSLDKQLDEMLGMQREIVNTLNDESKNDEDLKFITDLSNRTLTTVEDRRKKISKRSIPLTRLISDPNVKLDVPRSMENFGTAAKKSFEDERAPMYHLRHLVGSSKNAVLSAMKIPPQNMIIPSDYEIVRSSERAGTRARSRPDPNDPFAHTFRRVGEMVRESIKSGQETASHIGEVAHSAKNMLNSARHSAPRLIIPYSQIPVLEDTRRRDRRPNKAVLITPRILNLAEERTGSRRSSESRPDFVRLGHLMDAVGISKPDSKNLELQKIVFEPRRISEARVDERLTRFYNRFRNDDTVGEALNTLEDAKISVGAKNLRDFLVKMRNQLTNIVASSPEEPMKVNKTKKRKKEQQETKEMGKFIENLFDGSRDLPRKDDGNEIVGEGMFLPAELLHPFMGRPSKTELHNFLRDYGDEDHVDTLENRLEHQENMPEHQQTRSMQENRKKVHQHARHMHHGHDHDDSNLGYVLGAINPMMFERLYNQTVKINKDNAHSPEELYNKPAEIKHEETGGNGTMGTYFALDGPMQKPFMGYAQPQQVKQSLNTYNGDENADYVEMED